MKKVLSMLLIISVLSMAMLSGCGQSSEKSESSESAQQESSAVKASETAVYEKPEIVLRYGELNPDTHPMTMAARHFADEVLSKSNGRISIEVYPSGTLGDEKTEVQSVQMGALDMFRIGSSFLADYGVDMMKVFELPYLFKGVDHAWNVLDSDIGTQFLTAVDDADIKMIGIGYFVDSPRNYFFSEAQVSSVSDMESLKVRVRQSEMDIETTNAFGASATPIAYSELYSALQTGVVDGAENALTAYEANKFYEVAPYYTFDAHSMAPYMLVFSEINWNKLAVEDQNLLLECWDETEKWYRTLAAEKDEEAMTNLKAQGVEFFEVDNAKEWVDAVAPIYEKFGAGYEDVIESIQSME